MMEHALMTVLQSLPDVTNGGSPLIDYARTAVNFAAVALVAYVLYRSRSSEVIQGEMKAWKEKAERLEKEKETLMAENASLDKSLAECQARTDLSSLRAEIKDGQLAIATMLRDQTAAVEANTKAVLSSQSHTAATFESLSQLIKEWRLANGKA